MSGDQECHHTYKFVLVGDANTGKTFLSSRYTKDELPKIPGPTTGVEFATTTKELPNGARVKMQLWDTAGRENYRAVTAAHYRRALGGIICYDVTDKHSFESVRDWHKELLEKCDETVCTMIVGTKLDLADRGNRQVAYDEGAKLAEELHSTFIETSAENSMNVSDAFEQIIHNVYFKQQGISGFDSVLVTVRKDHVPEGHEDPTELHFTSVAGEEILKMQFDRSQHNFASIMTSLQEILQDVKGTIKIALEDGTLVADDKDLSSFLSGTAKLETQFLQSESSSKLCSAPYLDEYFKVYGNVCESNLQKAMVPPFEIFANSSKLKELKAEEDKLKELMKEIIGKSFDHHDVNKNGTLDVAESKEFFGNFVERYIPFLISSRGHSGERSFRRAYEPVLGMMEAAEKEQALKEMEELLKSEKKTISKQMTERQAKYEADKDGINAKAFRVIDKNATFKLERDQVIDALFPNSDTNLEFTQALGMTTASEAEEIKAQQKAISECAESGVNPWGQQ